MSDVPPASRLRVSREGLILIKSFEGFRPRAERLDDGRWVIGYGHTASAREGAAVSEAEAELLLQYDLVPVVEALNGRVTQPLNQHQFDALASFAVSIGVDRFLSSDVLGRINAGQSTQAAEALAHWPDDSLPDASLRRRAAERALFVADPAAPARLSDLLAAPLAPEPDTGVVQDADPVPTPVEAEPVLETEGWPPAEVADPETAPEPLTAEDLSVEDLSVETPASGAAGDFSEPAFPAFPAVETPGEVLTGEPEAFTTEEVASPFPAVDTDVGPQDLIAEPLVADFSSFPNLADAASRSESLLPAGAPEDTLSLGVTPLVLTPGVEADFGPIQRQVWDETVRGDEDDTGDLPLDEPALSIVRHEASPSVKRRFDWEQTGAWLVMALAGLVACGASAAALRLAETRQNADELSVIGWCLAVIALICVGVSAWNLYVRWGRGG